ncbi:sulfotransferase 2A1-like [Glandiceps talaboti]
MASNKCEWPVFCNDGCFFIDHIHDSKAVEERRLDKLWDIRDTDIIISTFAKSGTLWTLTLLSEMYDDLNWKLPATGKAVRLSYIYEKTDEFVPGLYGEQVRHVKKSLKDMPSPRLLVCHLPSQFFHTAWKEGTRKCKVISITRNPKDVCVSLYHFMKSIKFTRMKLSWEEWVEAFVDGKVWFGPWLDHVEGWNKYGVEDNVFHLSFEEMKTDLKSSLEKIAEFLGRPVCDAKLDEVVKSCSMTSMKKNNEDSQKWSIMDEGSFKKSGQYLRKGKVGDWKSHFTVAQNEYFDDKITKEAGKRGIKIQYV